MKKKLAWVGILLLALVLVSVPFGIWRALAAAPPYEIKILEITDNPVNGKYPLAEALKDTQHVTVETMRMKKFVALRDELDGKYDAVYFGAGTYNPELPKAFPNVDVNAQAKEHDTTNKMNDITKLKVKEITDKYISNGLPVIFNRAIAANQPSGNLRTFYNNYLSGSASNVLYVDGASDASFQAVVNKVKNGDPLFQQRPQLKVTSKPEDFTQVGSRVYTTGDTLTFDFDAYYVRDFSSPVNVKLYASVDKALPMTEENVVASKTITQQRGSITYKLPQTYSGPVYWKLVLAANTQSDYASGAFRVRDQKTVIRVLQVMPSNDDSSLTKEANMTQAYLKSNDYEIQITPILFKDFNTAGNVNSYENLNGKYDMVIFGFIDNYNSQTSSNLTAATAKGVNDFIRTGQAVMFTHDTMIGESGNPWIKNFQQTTGQTGLYTNLGRSAPNKSTRTTIVNSGMLTQFPFDLSQKPGNTGGFVGQIAQTHDQYYMLDLEDPNLVPWYNIVSEPGDTYKRDTDDSYDHYYTYSKGNMTYSGTGHTNIKFPEWEQKLFVNTMFRAFIGSNHAPIITVLSPTGKETKKPSYLSNLNFSYQVDDLDLKDLNVFSSVRFKVNGQYVDSMAIKEKPIQKGQVITETFANPLPLDSGTIQIEINARDKQGAKVTKTIDLTVEKVTANLKTDRTRKNADANSEIKLGDTVSMTYTVTPQDIPAANIRTGEKGLKSLEIDNVVYTETIPAGLRLGSPLPQGVTADGSPDTGYTLTRKLDKVVYTLSSDNSKYTANANSTVSFDLSFIPLKKGYFNLNQARLNYDDIHAPAGSTSSSSTNSEAVQMMQKYSLIVLGSGSTTVPSGTVEGRIAVNGPTTFGVNGGLTVGEGISSSDSTYPAVVTSGDLTMNGGSILNGSVLTGGNFKATSLDMNQITKLIAVGDVTFSSSNGPENTLYYGGNYYGTTYHSPQGIGTKTSADTLKTQVSQAFDFSAANTNFKALSDSYAKLAVNGTNTLSYSTLTLNSDASNDINVFKLTAAELADSKKLVINVTKPNSTVIINVEGNPTGTTDVALAWGFEVNNTTSSRVLFNFQGTGTLGVHNIDLKGSILAPYANVNFGNGNIHGTIVSNSYENTQGGGFAFYLKDTGGFSGSAPSTPVVAPAPPEKAVIRFPDKDFTVLSKVTSIQLDNQSIWVGDELKMIPIILPADADNKQVTWSSDRPDIATVSNDGPPKAGTVTGMSAGTATITVKAADGSGVIASAKVKVEPANIEITGGPNVNVDETISDLRVISAGVTRPLTEITWSLIGQGDSSRAKLGEQVHGATVSLTGNEAGTVMLQVKAKMTSPITGNSREYTTTRLINVLNPMSGAALSGPNWVEVGHSIPLDSTVQPAGVHLSSVQWQMASGATNGSLSNTTSGSVIRSNTFTGSNTPGLATVEAKFVTSGDNPVTLKATKDIRVVDLQIGGPKELYIGRSGTLNAEFLTYQPENWSDKPTDYSWTLTNLVESSEEFVDADGKVKKKLIVDPNHGTPPASFNGSPTASTANPSIAADQSGGYVRVTLTVGGMTETKDIRIIPYLQQLQLRSPIDLNVGESIKLQGEINITPGSLDPNEILPRLEWSSENTLIATVGNASVNKGEITGVREGSTRVTVIYPSPGPGFLPVSASTIINVHAKKTPPTDPENPGGEPSTGGGDRY
ncbi:hypothetical protein B9G55_10235 [Saccharibacillus sp. O16]|nr:hypothetical protein B9G55_10235 [Saccharibacillus sp. O16]